MPHEGAEREPFGLTASPDDYVPTAAVERVLGDCQSALDSGRVPVVSGPTGLGKTLVLQILGQANRERLRPLYVPFCSLAPDELAELVLGLLEWPAGSDPERALLDAARRAKGDGRPLLLLVDDAAALPGDSAAQLAHWVNASEGALAAVLAGLPGAALRHARDAFGDRAEEVLLSGGIRPEELRPYVEARLDAAGAEPAIREAFDDDALAELARISDGNPRKLHLAAQAIVRNAWGASVEAREPEGAAAASGPDTTVRHTPAWEDLAEVGEYRFVRGRFVDASGEPAAPFTAREEIAAEPLPRAASAAVDTEPELEVDPQPEAFDFGTEEGEGEEPFSAEPGAPPLPVAEEAFDVAPRYAPPPRRSPLPWVAAGIAGVAFAIGLWSQLGGEEASAPAPVPIATAEPVPEPVPAVAVAPEPEAATPEPVATAESAPAVEPEPIAEPEPEAPVATEPEALPEPEVVAEPAPPPAETIAIAINATPWAVIEIDGEEIGETPLAGIELTTGRHRFRARMPDGSVRERVVRIDADTSTVVFE